jgi:hypothetical protein
MNCMARILLSRNQDHQAGHRRPSDERQHRLQGRSHRERSIALHAARSIRSALRIDGDCLQGCAARELGCVGVVCAIRIAPAGLAANVARQLSGR